MSALEDPAFYAGQREAVEKARREINGGEQSRLRGLSACAVPIFRHNRPVRWGEKN